MSITSFKFEVSSLKFRDTLCSNASSQFEVSNRQPRKSHGLSLIELIVSIVVIAVAVAGVLGALAIASRTSADPMIQKQALAIAEAFLEETQLMPFTFCDPGDANATTAQSATVGPTGCSATVEGIGVEGGETRYGPTFFDNVSDYNGYDSNADAPPGIKDINQSPIAELGGYRVQVSVAGQPLQGIGDDANGRPQSLLITVTVTGPDNTTVRLDGYRTRYAPNANVP